MEKIPRLKEKPIPAHIPPMQAALAAAQVALPEDVPVGAVLVCQGEIIATSCNRREARHDPVGHAEILLLQEAGRKLGRWRLDDCTLYVTLEPCPMCAAAISQARIAQVVYGADDPLAGACGSRYQLLGDIPVLGGVLGEECRTLLTNFFRAGRQKG